jgi:hypothetical protein
METHRPGWLTLQALALSQGFKRNTEIFSTIDEAALGCVLRVSIFERAQALTFYLSCSILSVEG